MVVEETRRRVTELLRLAGDDGETWKELLPLVYEELRSLAQRHMGGERASHTLQATALVHEAWVRLAGDSDMHWAGRRHFFGAAARAMQRVLVDHARKVSAKKRGGDRARMSISLSALAEETDPDQVIALDDALDKLGVEDERAAEVMRLRFFAGFEFAQIAQTLEVSERTVMREWAYARARLTEMLGTEGELA